MTPSTVLPFKEDFIANTRSVNKAELDIGYSKVAIIKSTHLKRLMYDEKCSLITSKTKKGLKER